MRRLGVLLALLVVLSLMAQENLHQKAIGLLRDEKYDEAIEVYKEILKQNPGDTTALYNTACA